MTENDLNSASLSFVEGLYEDFLKDPASVPADWQEYFRQQPEAKAGSGLRFGPTFRAPSLFHGAVIERPAEGSVAGNLQDRVNQFMRAYRWRGHIIARLDPLGQPRAVPPELDPAFYNFTAGDLDQKFACEPISPQPLPLREIIQHLEELYCRSIGIEFMHIDNMAIRRWVQERVEVPESRFRLTRQEQVRILTKLTDAVMFEEFIRKKFIGAKSFSLEGSESLIPLLDLAIEKAAEQGVTEIVFGMAHRGRLNVLANIMQKHPKQIFREFADVEPEKYRGRGDVKYHLGHSHDWVTSSGRQVHLSLCFNPSHLEFVNPIVLGRTRANQDRRGDHERTQNMALLIHGDASFAGQGVVQEILNLSQLPGYFVGGTLHIIVNNQIGFTTSPSEGRSTFYATDIAKMLQIPIFHVNGEDPEAVMQVVRWAMDFRAEFKRDVIIDVYGYRRLGHNEGDEPSFTQPILYRAIEQRKPVREGYLDHLLKLKGVTREEADMIADERRERLDRALSESRRSDYKLPTEAVHGVWAEYPGGPEKEIPEVKTGVDAGRLAELLRRQTELPADFHPHPKIKKLLENRKAMADGGQPLDWAAGEALAFATLASDGFRIRLTGQDSERGTFSHRHAVLHDFENGKVYVPLQHLEAGTGARPEGNGHAGEGKQGPVEIINSPLSEMAVLGFELGYSMEWPDGLVSWEAQFGDFWNGAQVIVDQFLISAEKKWRRLSGLVLLLPHGFEGQGPEHSSARLERFLSLAAEDNIQIANPTTPAQFFHLLRRQALRKWRKPLVVMTPKSLLRHPKVVSPMAELATGKFHRVLGDTIVEPAKVERILFCSGKIYYELDKRREETKRTDVAILRLEQLYPVAPAVMEEALRPYAAGTPVVWVQEEPENMGAWPAIRARLGESLFGQWQVSCICRPPAASPATGSANSHKQEQEQILEAAFGPDSPPLSNNNVPEENGKYVHRIESPRSRRIHHGS